MTRAELEAKRKARLAMIKNRKQKVRTGCGGCKKKKAEKK